MVLLYIKSWFLSKYFRNRHRSIHFNHRISSKTTINIFESFNPHFVHDNFILMGNLHIDFFRIHIVIKIFIDLVPKIYYDATIFRNFPRIISSTSRVFSAKNLNLLNLTLTRKY